MTAEEDRGAFGLAAAEAEGDATREVGAAGALGVDEADAGADDGADGPADPGTAPADPQPARTAATRIAIRDGAIE